jgi:hypothetical protein
LAGWVVGAILFALSWRSQPNVWGGGWLRNTFLGHQLVRYFIDKCLSPMATDIIVNKELSSIRKKPIENRKNKQVLSQTKQLHQIVMPGSGKVTACMCTAL